MKTKILFSLSIIILLFSIGGAAFAQSSSLWFPSSGFLTPVLSTFGIWAQDDLRFDDEILPDGLSCSNGEILKKTAADDWDCAADATGAGSGAFSDAGDPVVLNTTSKNVEIGDTGVALDAKVQIGGDADEVQLIVEAHSTQTDDVLIVQADDETQGFTVSAGGLVSSLVGFDCIGNVDCDFGSADVDDFTFTTDGTGDGEIVLPDGSIGASEILDDALDFLEIKQDNTLAGNPSLAVDECYFLATTTGGGFICEGSTADTSEQLYLFPDVNGADTTNRIVVDNTEVTSIDGDGLTISGGILAADLGTSIVTGEITDDTILEADLDLVDTPSDEQLLSYESGAGGDFEWHDIVDFLTGGNAITITGTTNATIAVEIKDNEEDGVGSASSTSGLEFESGELTLLQGCADNEILKWDETEDDWNCEEDGGGAGSGDNVTVNSTAVDTTANFLDSIYGDFDIADGGAGGPDDVTFTIEYGQTLAGNPALAVDQCIPFADTSGGGFLCEGSTANTNEQLYRLPDADGADTTEYIVVADDANVSATEAGYLDGVTSAIQTQLDAKEVQLDNEAGLYAVLSDVTNFLQTGDALAGDDITDGSVDASEIGDGTIDFAEIKYDNTLAGNPALAVDECFWLADTSGGGIICEGSTADTSEQLYRFPDANGADTTEYFVVADDANVSAAEAGYLDGVTSAIQTQIDGKEGTLTNSAGLAAALSDETGTGLAVFATSPTFTTSIIIGSAGVSITDDGDGAITFLGLGNGSDENLVWNFDDTSNEVDITSGTGVTRIDFNTIDLATDNLDCTGCLSAGVYGAASIDGDDINSNIAGAYLTLTAASPDTLDVDNEVVERTKTWIFSRDTDGDDGFIASSTAPVLMINAITLQSFACDSSADASSTMQVEWRSGNDALTAGTSTLSAELTSGGAMASTTSFAVTNIDAYSHITPVIVNASSTAGEFVTCTLGFKVNDA